jgi:exodeoxyribonuclease VII small subunit
MSKKVKYADAIIELRAILDKIQSDDISIDDLAASIKKADTLIDTCKTKLRGIEEEIDSIKKKD